MLLFDANNAFNGVNRQLALWQARIYWPRCAKFLYKCYQGYAEFVIRNSNVELYTGRSIGNASLYLGNFTYNKIRVSTHIMSLNSSIIQGKVQGRLLIRPFEIRPSINY